MSLPGPEERDDGHEYESLSNDDSFDEDVQTDVEHVKEAKLAARSSPDAGYAASPQVYAASTEAQPPGSDLRTPAAPTTGPPGAPLAGAPPHPAASHPPAQPYLQPQLGDSGSLPTVPPSPSAQLSPLPPKPQGQPPSMANDGPGAATKLHPPPHAATRSGDTLDNGNGSGSRGPGHTKATLTLNHTAGEGTMEMYDDAKKILKSSLVHHITCLLTLLLSIVIAIIGFTWMTDESLRPITALAFLASQAWALSGKIRDHRIATVAFPQHAQDDPISFVHPRSSDFIQVGIFSTAAVVFAALSIMLVDVSAEWSAFSALVMLWVVNNCIVCSRDLRDRMEASVWEETPPDRVNDELKRILAMCGGAIDYKISACTTFFLGFVTTIVWIFAGFSEDDLHTDRKLLMTIFVLWNVASNLFVSRSVYTIPTGDLLRKIPDIWDAVFVANWVLALAITTICIFMWLDDDESSFWLFSCLLVTSSSTLHVAKVYHDREEAGKLINVVYGVEAPPLSTPSKSSRVTPQSANAWRARDGWSTMAVDGQNATSHPTELQ